MADVSLNEFLIAATRFAHQILAKGTGTFEFLTTRHLAAELWKTIPNPPPIFIRETGKFLQPGGRTFKYHELGLWAPYKAAEDAVKEVLEAAGLTRDPMTIISSEPYASVPPEKLTAMSQAIQRLKDALELEDKPIAELRDVAGATVPATKVEAQGSKTRNRGAPRQYDRAKDKKAFDAWNTRQYKTFAECAVALGGEWTERKVGAAVDRQRKRESRLAVK